MSSLRVKLARFKYSLIRSYLKVLDFLSNSDRLIRFVYHHNGYHNPGYSFDENEINFLHLPKTGGTSLCKILERDPEQRFGKLNIHRPVSINCPPAHFRYVTVMREPVARVWSYYQMVLRSEPGYPYQKWARKGLNVFLKKCWAARNMSCRYLSSEVDAEPNEQTLRKAEQHLSQFYAVIDFGDFSEEVVKFMKDHHIPFEQIPNERNFSYNQPKNAEIELIKSYNQWDIALYEYWKRDLKEAIRLNNSTGNE
ncbi:hypothetical protein [Roseivirga sp.]|uniref:hypothetical protein n=1 Tax=Roseivirga sp. TaxID=1964215 RepID=UPI003B8E7225